MKSVSVRPIVVVLILVIVALSSYIAAQSVSAQTTSDVPSGAVMFFDTAVCPTGWTELTEANGRYLVGLPAGGTLGTTVGAALTDGENRAVGQHSHAVADPGHTHTLTDPGHSHSVTDPGHMHDITDPGHSHSYNRVDTAANNWGDNSSDQDTYTDRTSTETTGITINTASTGISLLSNTTGVTLDSATTGISATENEGDVAGTNAPYLQLLICKKD